MGRITEKDFRVVKGSDFTFTVNLFRDEYFTEGLDLTGWRFSFTIRDISNKLVVHTQDIEGTSSNSVVIVTINTNLLREGRYVYDIAYVNDEDFRGVLLRGNIVSEEGVSERIV